ncbi:hypothetical protein [Rhizobium sp. LEGMi135b]
MTLEVAAAILLVTRETLRQVMVWAGRGKTYGDLMAVSAAEEEAIISRLAEIDAAPKSLDSFPEWNLVMSRPAGKLYWTSAVRLSGVLGGGVSVRFATPADVWDKDVYGHIEVAMPVLGPRRLRINPAEWRPRSDHRNPAWVQAPHALSTYRDRWHPFDLNKERGISIFLQGVSGAAVPLPDDIETFSDYLHFCGAIWKCPDVEKVQPPPWSPQLV